MDSDEPKSTTPQTARQREKERLWRVQTDRLREALAQKGMSASALSKASGAGDITYFRDFLSGKKLSIDANALTSAAEVLNIDPVWLAAADTQPPLPQRGASAPAPILIGTLPLLGLAVGGSDGKMIFSGESLDRLSCPPQLSNVKNAYAVAVSGESMEPRYRAGEIAYVNPSRPPRRGDDVVVQVKIDGELAGYIKEFVSRTDSKVTLQQHNPSRQLIFKAEQVESIHVIELATR